MAARFTKESDGPGRPLPSPITSTWSERKNAENPFALVASATGEQVGVRRALLGFGEDAKIHHAQGSQPTERRAAALVVGWPSSIVGRRPRQDGRNDNQRR
jgi:hypothetical protein